MRVYELYVNKVSFKCLIVSVGLFEKNSPLRSLYFLCLRDFRAVLGLWLRHYAQQSIHGRCVISTISRRSFRNFMRHIGGGPYELPFRSIKLFSPGFVSPVWIAKQFTFVILFMNIHN